MTSSIDVFAVYKYSRLRKSKSRIRDLSCNRKFIIRKYNSYHSSGVSPPGKGAESFVVSPWWRPRQIDGRSVGITLCYATLPENKSKQDLMSVCVASILRIASLLRWVSDASKIKIATDIIDRNSKPNKYLPPLVLLNKRGESETGFRSTICNYNLEPACTEEG